MSTVHTPSNGSSVALEISSAPAPIADNCFKRHRRTVIIMSVVALSLLLVVGGIVVYFVGYKPSQNSGSSTMYTNNQFQLWMDTHSKSYTDETQQVAAFNNWLQNLQSVHSANHAETGVKYELGPYADLTPAQFQEQILTLQRTAPRSSIHPAAAHSHSNDKIKIAAAATLNWADNAAMVSPVKNQGSCGDCWAFTVAQAFEVAYNVAYQPSTSIQLSPQQINSCDSGYGDQGCNGGDPVNVYQNYLSTSSGNSLTTEANYPYTNGDSGTTAACDTAAASTGFVQLSSFSYAVNPTNTWSQTVEDALIQALQTSPVAICVDASPWQNYAGGVLSNSDGGCTGNQADLDHAVQLVGYTATYWIVKNQWGTNWGDNGFIYLARGDNTCCIFCEATQVTVTSTQSR